MKINLNLCIGGTLSIVAGLFHIAIILGGSQWYREYGLGEEMAVLVDNGQLYPHFMTFIVAITLIIWGCYAFSGAGVFKPFPLLKPALVWITIIYSLRGIAFIPAFMFDPQQVSNLIIQYSLLCMVLAAAYALGVRQVWAKL